jgi:hypothetical protein
MQESFAPVIISDADSSIMPAKPAAAECAIMRDGWQQPKDGAGRQGPPPAKLGVRLGWYQAVHMPRWASRLDLLITEVRVESLQTISDADARAEGFASRLRLWPSPRARFRTAWDETRGTPGERWDDNPAVVVLGFMIDA